MKLRNVGILAVILLVGAAVFLAVGSPDSVARIANEDSGSVETPGSTGTVYTDSGSGKNSTTNSASGGVPFTFSIQNIEKCGQTCRDVTVTLTNSQDQQADDVTVYTRIYAGNSTAGKDLVWQEQKEIGSMAAGESVTRTQRVKLSFQDAYAVKQADGWITVVTTIESADTAITFKSNRDVA